MFTFQIIVLIAAAAAVAFLAWRIDKAVKNLPVQDQLSEIVQFNKVMGNEIEHREFSDDLPKLYLDLVKEESAELFEAFDQENRPTTLKESADTIVTSAGVILSLGADPVEVVRRINESNMSKYCKTKEEAVASVLSYQNGVRYTDVHYKKVGDVYAIFGWKAGFGGVAVGKPKLLKGINYHDPDLSDL